MRILSQDGNIDVNYDLVALVSCYKCKDGNGWFEIDMYSGALSAKNVRMAKYSTEAKARKAMEMLREEYTGIPSTRRMDDLYGRFEHTGKKDFELFIEHMVLKKCYFQFPTDDEVEV